MAYKIAVASSDGKVINEHFGKATKFLIFNIDEDRYEFSEVLEASPFCSNGDHNEEKLLLATEKLAGCRAVLITQIGYVAVKALESRGIEVFEIKTLIGDALNKIILYYLKVDGGIKYD